MIHLGYRTKSKRHMWITTNREGRSDLRCPVNNIYSDLYATNVQKEKQNTKLLQKFVICLQKFSLHKKGKCNVKTAVIDLSSCAGIN